MICVELLRKLNPPNLLHLLRQTSEIEICDQFFYGRRGFEIDCEGCRIVVELSVQGFVIVACGVNEIARAAIRKSLF